MVGKVRFEARIKELVENIPDLAVLVEPLLIVRRVLRDSSSSSTAACSLSCGTMRCAAFDDGPGRCPVVSLTYRATVERPRSLPYNQSPSGPCLG